MTSYTESTLRLDYFCRYLTEVDNVQWRSEDYEAMNMVRALKGDELKGYFDLVIKGTKRRFNSQNANEFFEICHLPYAHMLTNQYKVPVELVPIPSSRTVDKDCPHFRTKSIAERIASLGRVNATCKPLLLFQTPMSSSRQGGTRDPSIIELNLKLSGTTDGNIILIDDVYTSGAHVKACAWKLKNEGMNVIGAVCFARSVKDTSKKAVGPYNENVDITKTQITWDF